MERLGARWARGVGERREERDEGQVREWEGGDEEEGDGVAMARAEVDEVDSERGTRAGFGEREGGAVLGEGGV